MRRWHFAASEEVAVDAPKMDCLGGLLHRWLRALGLALSVLPRTAKLVVLYMISHEKENLRAEVDATDESDGLQVEVIPFRQDDQPHPAPKRNKHLRLSQPTNQHINHHPITIPQPTCNRTRNRRTDGSTVTKPPRTISPVSLSAVPGPCKPTTFCRML